MTSYPDKSSPEIISQRDVLFNLFAKRKYSEAADLVLSAAEKDNLYLPIEEIADYICKTRPDDALRLYDIALVNARLYVSWATSGAEELAMSQEVRMLEHKVARFRNEINK